MLRFIDLNYYTHEDLTDIAQAADRFSTSYGYVHHIKEWLSISIVKHLAIDAEMQRDGVGYKGFKSRNRFFHIPFNSHRYIKTQKPDVVLIQGFVFPVQVIALRWLLGKRVKLIAQHHGESPFQHPVKRWFQKWQDKCIDAYLFTALGNADTWVQQGVISSISKCHKVLEASSYFTPLDKEACKGTLGITGNKNFLWVGRLIPGKDPVTVLKAFDSYLTGNSDAHLYMIYQDDTMLAEAKAYIDSHSALREGVTLVGKVPHDALQQWYSACEFFVSASHKEAAGFALIECMACGCIPILSDIPPFVTMTDNSRVGLLFEKADVRSLISALQASNNIDRKAMSAAVLKHFEEKLSFKAIAQDIYEVCQKLTQ